MEEQSKREYCFHCRRWLDGDTYYVDIPMNRYFCSQACAVHVGCLSAERVRAPKPEAEPESAPTQKPLHVPDIFLAELIGVVRRALQADGLTERLWAILDDWCDEQESYLEKAYPEAHEQAESAGTAAVDWFDGRGPVFPGLDTFIRMGGPPPSLFIPASGFFSPEDHYKVQRMLRDCTCQGFQGDNPTCAFHGEGTAWHDLHGGE